MAISTIAQGLVGSCTSAKGLAVSRVATGQPGYPALALLDWLHM